MKRNKKPTKPHFHTRFHVNDDSQLKEVDPSSQDWSGNDSYFFYVIDREEVEACDPSRLLHDLRPEPDNPFMKAGPGTVIFSVNGYDDDPRNLLEIPEVRDYFETVHEHAPCWLYFSMPGNGWLRIVLAASISGCHALGAGDGQLQVGVTKIQVAEFMEPQIQEYFRLREMNGIGGNGIDSHLYQTMQDSFPELLHSPTMN